MDILSKSDPFVVVYHRYEDTDVPTPWVEAGRTETIWNEQNPRFQKRIEMAYMFNHSQGLKFEVYDRDSKREELSKHDFIGSAETTLSRLLTAKGQKLSLDLKTKMKKARGGGNRGKLRVSAEESLSAKEYLLLGLTGQKISKSSMFGRNYPCHVVIRALDENKWEKIVQTPVSSTSRKRNEMIIPTTKVRLQMLRHLSESTEISLEVIKKGKISLGKTLTTWGALRNGKIGSTMNLEANGVKTGQLSIRELKIGREHTFLDYIAGGYQIELAVGIDFTASNGNISLPTSLHHFGAGQMKNDYERAIESVGSILANYDSDNIIPAYGFGAKLPPTFARPNHCFNLTGNPNDESCHGVSGLLSNYHVALRNTKLSGPTVFSEIIKKVADCAQKNRVEEAEAYTILFLLTDGAISSTDWDATVHEIVKASTLPMSIVIVGVGSSDFTAMEVLDADDKPLTSGGKKMTADIVQFVPFRKFENSPGALAAEVLEEIPRQFMDYMVRNKIKPRPPLVASDTASVHTTHSYGVNQVPSVDFSETVWYGAAPSLGDASKVASSSYYPPPPSPQSANYPLQQGGLGYPPPPGALDAQYPAPPRGGTYRDFGFTSAPTPGGHYPPPPSAPGQVS